ncbi:hypothetical protein L195_g030314 [Trifolium pratense]|uniref:Uncharacterized protein n=1 Tax=Trifolium pratense TaxID=57577 RepID=A0A2K3L788_TRIPR|nr:hypothetical protein L195_g030314 [Trifolium pratense]
MACWRVVLLRSEVGADSVAVTRGVASLTRGVIAGMCLEQALVPVTRGVAFFTRDVTAGNIYTLFFCNQPPA